MNLTKGIGCYFVWKRKSERRFYSELCGSLVHLPFLNHKFVHIMCARRYYKMGGVCTEAFLGVLRSMVIDTEYDVKDCMGRM